MSSNMYKRGDLIFMVNQLYNVLSGEDLNMKNNVSREKFLE